MSFTRYAIYYLPPAGALADFGARWLGWDVRRGAAAVQLDLPGLRDATEAPRKYGFHGTLKPPFRLAEGQDFDALRDAVAALAATLASARCGGLALVPLGRFLALVPEGDAEGIGRVAAACVRDLDGFRAPPSDAELARRRAAQLSPRQEAHLSRWGYPYVMEDFRFHLTLTGRLPRADIGAWTDTLRQHLPPLPAPFVLDRIALVGERTEGGFALIEDHALTG